jgi:hypothetical protein
MNLLQRETGIKTGNLVKKHTVIQLVINSLHTRPVRKRFLNFYRPVRPLTTESKPNETKRVQ